MLIVPLNALLAANAVLFLVTFASYLRMRDTRSSRPVIAQYEPPAGISLLVGAIITRERTRSISAQVVDLAVRRALLIYPRSGRSGAFTMEFLTGDGLDAVEWAIVRSIFGRDARPGDRATMRTNDAQRTRHLRWAQFRAERESRVVLVRAARWWSGTLWLPTLMIAIIMVPFVIVQGSPSWLYAVAGAALCAGTIWAGMQTDALTPVGAEVANHLAGLKLFISLAEADRMRVLQGPDTATTRGGSLLLTEKLLGWAVLFGLGKEWAAALAAERAITGGDGTASSDEFGAAALNYTLTASFAEYFAGEADASTSGGDPYDPTTPSGFADTGSGDGGDGSDGGGSGDGGGGSD